MTHQEFYDELKTLAQEMGLAIRSELGDFDGGLCTVKSQRVILVNRRHDMGRRIHIIARSLHSVGIDDRFIKPALREVIEDEIATLKYS